MKNKVFFIFIFNLCVFSSIAQHQLSGTITDSSDGSPVPFATAALLRSDSTAVTGVMAGDDGKFVLENVAAGAYILQVSFIGYDRLHRSINVPAQSDLGEIQISESAAQLEELVVVARRPLLEHRVDRIVVNVSGNMIAAGNINDLLRDMPGLIVDENDVVKLNGRTATVHIDGRPTRLPAAQVAQLLNGMRGDLVDRVELIANPSARYEAGMSAAIVNIRLKRDASLGVNGSVMAGGMLYEYNNAFIGGANLNYRSKNFNIFGNYGLDNYSNRHDFYQTRNYSTNPALVYDQHSAFNIKSINNTLRSGIDWFINPRHTVGFLFNGVVSSNFEGNALSNSKISLMETPSAIDSTVVSDIRMTSNGYSQMYNLNYRFLTDSLGGELTADFDFGRVYEKSWQDMNNVYRDALGNQQRAPVKFQHTVPRNIDILSFKVDYSKIFSTSSRLETGIKAGETVTDNDILFENRVNDTWERDNSQTNHFQYREQISAAYLTYGRQLGGRFMAMIGVRAEHTSMKGESFTMDTTFVHDYLDFFPSAYLHYRPGDWSGLNLSYSRKIIRPGYSLLNPFRTYIDPFTYISGNSDLKPAYINTVELRYDDGGLSASIGYNNTTGVFEQEIKQDDELRVTAFTHNNVGKRQSYYFTSFAVLPFSPMYIFRLGPGFSWNIDNSIFNGEPFDKKYFKKYVEVYNTFNFSPFSATFSFIWYDNGWNGINKIDNKTQWYFNLNARYRFLDNRMTLAFACNDIFSSLRNKSTANFQNIDQITIEDGNRRTFRFTLTYNFGSQQIRAARNRSTGIEEEMGRARQESF